MARRRTPTRRTGRRPVRYRKQTDLTGAVLAAVVVVAALSFLAAHIAEVVLVLLAAAAVFVGVKAWKARADRQASIIRAQRAQHITAYLAMSPKQFEHALADLCRRDGCTKVRVVGGAGDLAADVIATTPDGRRIVLQAKRYGPRTVVGSEDIQKVNGTYRDAHHAQLAAIVTTSMFSKPALAFAKQVGIGTYDQQRLAAWAAQTGPAPWQ